MRASRRALLVIALAATAAVLTAGAIAGDKNAGFTTSAPSLLTAVKDGVEKLCATMQQTLIVMRGVPDTRRA